MESLYTKYRPSTFEDVVGQDVNIKILKKQVELHSYSNSIIFAGASGCGKTTLARIFAKAINKGLGEPIEIDAGSSGSVDSIRQIIDGAESRSLDSEYKIYILDEAHMLTAQAWNALLKTIEETPKYTIFMFCTTEFNKIPETIKNRCQLYYLKRIDSKLIYDRLSYIAKAEGYNCEPEALNHIAKLANGSMRQAISYLDKCKDFNKDLTVSDVVSVLGSSSYDDMFDVMLNIVNKEQQNIINTIERLHLSGADLKQFLNAFIDFSLDVAKYTMFRNFDIINIPSTYESKLKALCTIENPTKYFTGIMEKLMKIKKAINDDLDIKTSLEIYLCIL